MCCRERCAFGRTLVTLQFRVLLAAFCLGWASNVPAQQTAPASAPATAAPVAAAPATAVPAPAQAPLAFDVVSIHPSHPLTTRDGDMEIHYMRTNDLGDGYVAESVNLKFLISDAYHIKSDYISGGPIWIDSDSYDINAKFTVPDGVAPPKLTSAQRRVMLQALLADRFKLAVHNETKEVSTYELVVAKGGPKLHAFTPGDTFASSVKGPDGQSHPGLSHLFFPGQIMGQGISISAVADDLTSLLKRPVVDKTGIAGKYDIALRWTPDTATVAVGGEGESSTTDSAYPSLFTAVQEQLGLKLNATKGPVTTLVIDHIERPSEN